MNSPRFMSFSFLYESAWGCAIGEAEPFPGENVRASLSGSLRAVYAAFRASLRAAWAALYSL